jgi:hypothetical protein
VIDLLRPAHALALLSCFALDDLVCSLEVMARCSPLSEVAATNAAEVENVDRVAGVAEIVRMVSDKPTASDGEEHVSSLDVADDSLGKGASDDEYGASVVSDFDGLMFTILGEGKLILVL